MKYYDHYQMLVTRQRKNQRYEYSLASDIQACMKGPWLFTVKSDHTPVRSVHSVRCLWSSCSHSGPSLCLLTTLPHPWDSCSAACWTTGRESSVVMWTAFFSVFKTDLNRPSLKAGFSWPLDPACVLGKSVTNLISHKHATPLYISDIHRFTTPHPHVRALAGE